MGFLGFSSRKRKPSEVFFRGRSPEGIFHPSTQTAACCLALSSDDPESLLLNYATIVQGECLNSTLSTILASSGITGKSRIVSLQIHFLAEELLKSPCIPAKVNHFLYDGNGLRAAGYRLREERRTRWIILIFLSKHWNPRSRTKKSILLSF